LWAFDEDPNHMLSSLLSMHVTEEEKKNMYDET
jgi:hypothetical protein